MLRDVCKRWIVRRSPYLRKHLRMPSMRGGQEIGGFRRYRRMRSTSASGSPLNCSLVGLAVRTHCWLRHVPERDRAIAVIRNYPASVLCAGLLAQGTILSRLICLLHMPVYEPWTSHTTETFTFFQGASFAQLCKSGALNRPIVQLLSATFLPWQNFLEFI